MTDNELLVLISQSSASTTVATERISQDVSVLVIIGIILVVVGILDFIRRYVQPFDYRK